VDRRGLLASWDRAIPVEDKSAWRDPAVAEAYVRESLASDPTGESRNPPSMRIPRAFQLEGYNLSLGHKYWDAAAIRAPTLVIRGDRDHWSRPEDREALQAERVNAPRVRAVTIKGGTHYLFLDRPKRGRARFLDEVLALLAES
jgi:pimeloyl-ACP methyl ester carboxylesterase